MKGGTGFLEKRDAPCKNGELGCYFVIMDEKRSVIATSRVFRNEAWYHIGLCLFLEITQACVLYQGGRQWLDDMPRLAAERIMIIHERGDPVWRFEYVTQSNKMLLASIPCKSDDEVWGLIDRTILAAKRECKRLSIIE